MLGGVICGYCAIGSVQTATPPASVMTIDSTVAKIGRSMKKRENKVRPPRQEVRSLAGILSQGFVRQAPWSLRLPRFWSLTA